MLKKEFKLMQFFMVWLVAGSLAGTVAMYLNETGNLPLSRLDTSLLILGVSAVSVLVFGIAMKNLGRRP